MVSRTNNKYEKDIILTAPSHWRYQLMMADLIPLEYYMILLTGLGFDIFIDPYFPDTRNNVKSVNGLIEVPYNVDYAIIHERYQIFDTVENVAQNMGFPLIYVEQEMPKPGYQLEKMKKAISGAIVVFRSEEARDAWGYDESEASVIYDGHIINNKKREPYSSSWLTIHDHIDITCHPLWYDVRKKPFITLRGHNGCLAYETTESQECSLYESYKGYLNFRTDDCFPIEVGRAIANGMPIVSVPNEFLSRQFGDSIVFVNSAKELVKAVEMDLSSKGEKARGVLRKHFGYTQFQKQWKELLERVKYD
jgi:hypothetical protein